MNEDEDVCVFVELLDTPKSHLEVVQNLFMLVSVLDLEYVDENLYSSKDCFLLDEEILLHESILSSAIP